VTATAQSKTSALSLAYEAEADLGIADKSNSRGRSELLARQVKNESQPSSEEQHDQNHRHAELVFEVLKARTD